MGPAGACSTLGAQPAHHSLCQRPCCLDRDELQPCSYVHALQMSLDRHSTPFARAEQQDIQPRLFLRTMEPYAHKSPFCRSEMDFGLVIRPQKVGGHADTEACCLSPLSAPVWWAPCNDIPLSAAASASLSHGWPTNALMGAGCPPQVSHPEATGQEKGQKGSCECTVLDMAEDQVREDQGVFRLPRLGPAFCQAALVHGRGQMVQGKV